MGSRSLGLPALSPSDLSRMGRSLESASVTGLPLTTVSCGIAEKTHHAAVRALAFKWIRIAFRCWKDRVPYDDAHYVQNLRRRGSPLIALLLDKPLVP